MSKRSWCKLNLLLFSMSLFLIRQQKLVEHVVVRAVAHYFIFVKITTM